MDLIEETFKRFRTNPSYYVFYFHLPDVREEALNNFNIIIPNELLGQLIADEFDLYTHEFDTSSVILSAIKHDNLELIELFDLYEVSEYLELAAELGKLEIVKHLTRIQRPDRDNKALKLATMNGHYEVVKYLLDNRMYSNDDLLIIALKNNDKRLIDYLLNYSVSHEAINWVILRDSLNMFVKLYESYYETDYEDLVINAVKHNSVKIFQYLLTQYDIDTDFLEYIIYMAEKYNSTDILKLATSFLIRYSNNL